MTSVRRRTGARTFALIAAAAALVAVAATLIVTRLHHAPVSRPASV